MGCWGRRGFLRARSATTARRLRRSALQSFYFPLRRIPGDALHIQCHAWAFPPGLPPFPKHACGIVGSPRYGCSSRPAVPRLSYAAARPLLVWMASEAEWPGRVVQRHSCKQLISSSRFLPACERDYLMPPLPARQLTAQRRGRKGGMMPKDCQPHQPPPVPSWLNDSPACFCPKQW
jgi:hypothetical protein